VIDFPSNPTVGQQFSAAGVIWTWDGTKWTAQGLSPTFLPLSGGTLSGPLNAPVISLQNAAGNANPLWGDIGGNARWLIELGDGAAETGNNAGSNCAIVAYSDAALSLGADFTINRATGVVSASNLSAPQAIGSNRIINGDMRIDQRNNGNSGTANGYTVDRWFYSASQPGQIAYQRASGPSGLNLSGSAGFAAYLGLASQSAYTPFATDFFNLGQAIEADMVSDFNWGSTNAQPVTLSFWVNSITLSGTFSGSIANFAGTRSYLFSFTLTAGQWKYVVVTIPGDTAGTWVMAGNAGSIWLRFDLGSGANYRGAAGAWANGNLIGVTGAVQLVATNTAQLAITGVKLEVGSVATPFNQQSLAKSMADCQRYYQVGNLTGVGYQVNGQPFQCNTALNVWMRASPTMTAQGNNSANISSFSLVGTVNSVWNGGTATAAGTVVVATGFTASAEL
jgi:hypothetical protein